MNSVIVFLPNRVINNKEDGFIYGVINENICLKTINLVIHLKVQDSEVSDILDAPIKLIGYYSKENISSNIDASLDSLSNYVVIKNSVHEPEVIKLFSKGIFYPIECTRIVIYDECEFCYSELLLSPLDYFKNENEADYFKVISTSLSDVDKKNTCKSGYSTLELFTSSIQICIVILNVLINCCSRFKIIQKVSRLVVHFHVSCCNMKWAINDCYERKKITLKVGNYFLSFCVDWLLGIFVTYYLVNYINFNELYFRLAILSEEIVQNLVRLVHYLMGSPADLKLNHPLNSVLGRFFLYHIDLWWSFLSVIRPVLEYSFLIFVSMGFLGLSFQIAFLADMLAISSCHVYCIYVYAARLYNLQVTGLASLSRLFIGRKRNPLPGRVDSCPYTTEQLFIGTIAFTVLLFLLPTTLVYYIVFTTIRLILIFIGGLLTEARYLLQVLPIYVTFLWLFIPKYTTSSIELHPVVSKTGQLLLYMTPQQSSWWLLTKACIPDPVMKPESVEWQRLLKNLVSGQLIYPL